jgi:uncharacterized membrane protein YphA (DoxX/SURF4 family)
MTMLQPLALLLLRVGTGLLLVLWGALRVISPEAGPGLSEKYYSGLLGMQALQIAYGIVEIIIGTLVLLGLFRRIAYPLQALILVPGAVMLWRYLLDPLGAWLMSRADSQILFFPSITVAAATLALIAFRDFDKLSLDAYLDDRSTTR